MRTPKIVCVIILVFLFGFADYSNAGPFRGNNALPDVSNAETTVGYCDNGRTMVTLYTNEGWFLATVERSGWTLAVYSRSPDWPVYFAASPDEALHEISRTQYMEHLARISPNRFQQMKRQLNDCPKFN